MAFFLHGTHVQIIFKRSASVRFQENTGALRSSRSEKTAHGRIDARGKERRVVRGIEVKYDRVD